MNSWTDLPGAVEINEVGPRDGFQAEDEFIPTERKVEIIDALSRTGVAAIQVTSVVHPKAVPQLADAEEVMARIERVPGVRYTVLVPNLRGAERAVPMEADGWELMLSVTDSHSRSNANRNTDEALKGMEPVVALARESGVEVTGSMATALGCPFEGKVPFERVLYVAEAYRAMGLSHISVADTVGAEGETAGHQARAAPAQHARDGAGQRSGRAAGRHHGVRLHSRRSRRVPVRAGRHRQYLDRGPGARAGSDGCQVRRGPRLDARRSAGRQGSRWPPARERRRARWQGGRSARGAAGAGSVRGGARLKRARSCKLRA